jgi:hypothetical protein
MPRFILSRPAVGSIVLPRGKSLLRSFSVESYPLQQETNKDAPEAKGFNLLLQRVANMVVNVTEKQASRVLHTHCDSQQAFYSYIGRLSHVELNGYSTAVGEQRDNFKYVTTMINVFFFLFFVFFFFFAQFIDLILISFSC